MSDKRQPGDVIALPFSTDETPDALPTGVLNAITGGTVNTLGAVVTVIVLDAASHSYLASVTIPTGLDESILTTGSQLWLSIDWQVSAVDAPTKQLFGGCIGTDDVALTSAQATQLTEIRERLGAAGNAFSDPDLLSKIQMILIDGTQVQFRSVQQQIMLEQHEKRKTRNKRRLPIVINRFRPPGTV